MTSSSSLVSWLYTARSEELHVHTRLVHALRNQRLLRLQHEPRRPADVVLCLAVVDEQVLGAVELGQVDSPGMRVALALLVGVGGTRQEVSGG